MRTIIGRSDQALCFATVAECGSYTRAAELLGCSKAHVSKQVTLLERALGVELLHRTTRRQALTESGRVYLDYCTGARESLLEGERAVSALSREVAGRLRITAPSSFGDTFLVDLVLAFQHRHPAVEVEMDLSVARRDLIADNYDLAIRSTRVLDERLVARPLGVLREVLAAAPALLKMHGAPRNPDELARLPCVVNSHFSDDSAWSLGRDGGGSATVNVAGGLRINHYGGIRRAALAGAGVVRLPRYLLAEDLDSGRLLRVCPDWEPLPTPIHLVYPQRRHPPLRTRAFIEHLLRWFRDPVRRDWFG